MTDTQANTADPFALVGSDREVWGEPMSLRDVPRDLWRWPNFTPEELACKGSRRLLIHPPSLDLLQKLRTEIDRPFRIHSAYRSPAYNAQVGGAKGSMHLQARAYDVGMAGHHPHEFAEAARRIGFRGFGWYYRQGFLHIDTGPSRAWGEAWPRTPRGDVPRRLPA